MGEAQVHFQEALALDKLLDEAALPEPSLELTADILANRPPNLGQQWLEILWLFGPVWKPVSSLAMAMVIGLYVGTLTPASISDDVLTAELDTLIAGPNYTIEEQ